MAQRSNGKAAAPTTALVLAGAAATFSAAAALCYYFYSSAPQLERAPRRQYAEASTNTEVDAGAEFIEEEILSVRERLLTQKAYEAELDAEIQKLNAQRRVVQSKEMQLNALQQSLRSEISLNYEHFEAALVKDTAQQKERLSAIPEDDGVSNSQDLPQTQNEASTNSKPTPANRSFTKRRPPQGKPRTLSMQMSPSSKDMMEVLRLNALSERNHFEAWAQYEERGRRPTR